MRKTAARAAGWHEINLENKRKFNRGDNSNPYAVMADEMDVWGAVFWTLRARITEEVTDRLVVTTWLKTQELSDPKEFRLAFAQLLLS